MRIPQYPIVRAIRRIFRIRQIREGMAILPIVRRQLQETTSQVEDAVVSVCNNFTAIASRAREAVTESATLLDGVTASESATVEGAIETSRQTIGSLLEGMERAARLSTLAISSMEEVSRTVTGMEELLAQVQRIAFTNKLIALNAKIEAVHVGELGSGFEVVADEISRQADRSTELVGGITDHIQTMRGRMNSSAEDLRQFLAEGREKLDQGRDQAESALEILLCLHQRTRDSLERATNQNSRLAGDIAAAIVGLQFQDRMKQRVEHVIEALEKLEHAMNGSGSDVLGAVHSSYTMAAEREAHGRTAVQTASSTPVAEEMEVELF
jgi:methyl-accepting chemotaxis protein